MTRIARALAVASGLALALAGSLWAVGEGRVLGTVLDPSNKPVAGAKVMITSPEFKYYQEKTTDAGGKFTVIILDATRKYAVRIEKEGFTPYESPLDVKLGENVRVTYNLGQVVKGAGAPGGAGAPEALSGTNKAVAAYNEGVVAFQKNDNATAAAKFQEATGLDPKNPVIVAALAEVYLAQSKYAEAAAASEKFIELDPTKTRGLKDRYDAYKGLLAEAKAAKDTAKIQEYDAKTRQAMDALVAASPGHETAARLFNEGAEASREKRAADAEAAFKRAIQADPSLEQAYSALSDINIARKAYPESLALADQLAKADPHNPEANTIRYNTYKQMAEDARVKKDQAHFKEYDAKAKEAFAAAQASGQGASADSLFKQGVKLFNNNQIPQALQTFEQVLTVDPKYSKAYYMLGLSYANSGDTAKAKEHLKKFLELAPNDSDAKSAKEMLEYMQ
ncbi:MAG TPA: tetratricopeptide repeat protein [Thermoanaerobaculia bacterium]|nr:tetratricopeptide repeat protein [Thermoanaerobaculia bacterium]